MSSAFNFPPGRKFVSRISDTKYDEVVDGLRKHPAIDPVQALAQYGLKMLQLNGELPEWIAPLLRNLSGQIPTQAGIETLIEQAMNQITKRGKRK